MIKRYQALGQGSVDLAVVSHAVKARAGRLSTTPAFGADVIASHVDAIGRGERSISPVKARALKKG